MSAESDEMITAILILTIFNIGLTFIIGIGAFEQIKDLIMAQHSCTRRTVDADIEALGTAIYNMDSLKQKAEMSGKAEL